MSARPKLLDLFSFYGGAGYGYWLAGFDVTGVDIRPVKCYARGVGQFVQADAFQYLDKHWAEYDAIHASPPCQGYSRTKSLTTKEHPMLIEPVRNALVTIGKPYIIENVPGAPLINPTLLCGLMFGLDLYRHRLFETSFDVPFLMDYGHGRKPDSLKGKNRKREIITVVGRGSYKGYTERAQKAMGIDWMNGNDISQAIPPAYTEYIGNQLLRAL